MKRTELQIIANELRMLNEEIKERQERAEEIKNILRAQIPAEGIELIEPGTDNVFAICKKVAQTTPVFNNKKLYKLLTAEEIVQATKPIVSELKKIFTDSAQYEAILSRTAEWSQIECIKFYYKK